MDEKVKVLFIIPAHESNDCLDDTINNVKKYNQDIEPLFAIHVNVGFNDFDEQRFTQKNMVFMYCEDDMTGVKFESQLSPLLRTYKLAKNTFGDVFEYVKIFHTSELFLRTGFYNYIKDYETSFDPRSDGLPQRYHPIFDMKVFDKEDDIYYQGVELGFFSKEIFDKIVGDCYNFNVGVENLNKYFSFTPIEEVVLPTLAVKYAKKVGRNTLVFVSDLNNITLDPHQFSVKSVPRDINHPLRVYVRNL